MRGVFLAAGLAGILVAQTEGEKLHKQYCAACHRTDDKKLVGPGFAGVTKRVPSKEWFIKWVKNSQELIKAGDPYAVKIFEEYNRIIMPPQPLTDEQILEIWKWLESAPPVTEAAKEAVPAEEFKKPTPPPPIKPRRLVFVLGVIFLFAGYIGITWAQSYFRKAEAAAKGLPIPEEKWSPYRWFRQHKKGVAGVGLISFAWFCVEAWDWMWNIGVYQGYQPEQPIAFSHRVHAGKLEIPCEYCHSGALKGRFAGVPPLKVCMGCHRAIDRGTITGTTEIAKIYAAVGWDPQKMEYTGKEKPVEWVRVHKLPELAYFNHSQHVVVGGIKCQTCHGPVDSMDVVYQYAPLTMKWCINCHLETPVRTEGNAYYAAVVERVRRIKPHGNIVVDDIGGRECYKCHY